MLVTAHYLHTDYPGFIKGHYFKLAIKFTKLSDCSIRVLKLMVIAWSSSHFGIKTTCT